jgi:hypothetical protein
MELVVRIVEVYVAVSALSGCYHALKLVESKIEHDSARGKDSKNLRLQLGRHHFSQLKGSLLWPTGFKSLAVAFKWVREVRE